jgi:hypothetical protein
MVWAQDSLLTGTGNFPPVSREKFVLEQGISRIDPLGAFAAPLFLLGALLCRIIHDPLLKWGRSHGLMANLSGELTNWRKGTSIPNGSQAT